jgi:hypothetical protein
LDLLSALSLQLSTELCYRLTFRPFTDVQGGGGGAAAGAKHGDYSAGATTSGPDASAYANLPPIQRQVMEIVSADTGDDGMHVQAISRAANGNAGVM